MTFDATDASLNLVKSNSEIVHNKAGLFGAYAAGLLNDLFGIGALLWPFLFGALGVAYISSHFSVHWWRWLGFFLLTLCVLCLASAFDITLGDLAGGGMVGNSLALNSTRYLSPVGSFLLWLFVFLIGIQLCCNFSWNSLLQKGRAAVATRFASRAQPSDTKPRHTRISDLNPARFLGRGLEFFKPALAWARNISLMEVLRRRATAPPKLSIPASPLEIPLENKGMEEAPAASGQTLLPEEPWFENQVPEEKPQTPQDPALYELDDDLPFTPAQDLLPPEEPVKSEQEVQAGSPAHSPELPGQPAVRPLANTLAQARFPLPSPELLVPPAPPVAKSQELLRQKGEALMACFQDFGIKGELVKITPGPVVTLYEFRPAPGIRVNRIANLSNDLSLALKAVAIRIQAPIPGSDTIGIEIPNDIRETVNFRELIESGEFRDAPGPLTVILGKDIAGRPCVADLSRMPHLLIGGTTGAGKSVSLNAMLISLLYRRQPSELKLLLVDPKQVEMAVYADLPHLVHPVVTDMNDAKSALEWATQEMDNRYKSLSQLGAKNLAAFNRRLADLGETLPAELSHLKPLPYLVIVIDELADLMMTASREVEGSIQRLLAKARAAGIHLILATQRPSVNVVTGLLKANLSCRISFQVISRFDSRTILDQAGAEHLLGKGDMLYMPTGSRLQRLHAPYLSDEETQRVTNYWKSKQAPTYEIDFSKWSNETNSGSTGSSEACSDPLYEDAKAFVLERGQASISLLQRHLRIGFNRAARLTEQFEKEGIVAPGDGRGPRVVIHK